MEDYVWQTCPHCWGQRFILEPARNGEGLIPVNCNNCCAVGSTIELKETITT